MNNCTSWKIEINRSIKIEPLYKETKRKKWKWNNPLHLNQCVKCLMKMKQSITFESFCQVSSENETIHFIWIIAPSDKMKLNQFITIKPSQQVPTLKWTEPLHVSSYIKWINMNELFQRMKRKWIDPLCLNRLPTASDKMVIKSYFTIFEPFYLMKMELTLGVRSNVF